MREAGLCDTRSERSGFVEGLVVLNHRIKGRRRKLIRTNNGKPQAILLPVTDTALEEMLESIKQAQTLRLAAKMYASSAKSHEGIFGEGENKVLLERFFAQELLLESLRGISSQANTTAPVRDDAVLLKKRARNFPEMVRQLELGVADYVVNGDFLDEFYHAPQSERQSFLDYEPTQSSIPQTDDVFYAHCAAEAEKLAHDYNLKVPEWTGNPRYFLSEPNIAGFEPDQVSPELAPLLSATR
jgi:hypothetical protein